MAESGTADEFYRARKSYFETGKPRVLFYRCIRKPDLEKIDPRQLGKVRQFFQGFEPDGKHPGLVQNYKNKEEFGRHLRTHLGHIVRDAADYFLPSELEEFRPPDGYKTIGWIGRRVRLKNSGSFRVLIRKP